MHSSPVPPCPETDVVVGGEAIIDIIDTAAGPAEFPGGSGINVAFGLGRLGVSTAFIAGLIEDPEDDFGYGKRTRVGTAASLAAAITVGRHGANPPTRGEVIRSLELAQTYRKNSDD